VNEFWGEISPNLHLADLHIHTCRSDGLLTPQEVIDQAVKLHLSAIAITDHEVTDSALETRELAKNYPLEVVTGSEITTHNGHLLGLYLERNIPSGKKVEWTIDAIHDQNGLAIVPHPMYKWTKSLTENKILSIIQGSSDIYFDGFEIFNGGVAVNPWTLANQDAKDFYYQYQKSLGAPLGGSDTHFRLIGRGLTGYRGNLFESIKTKQTTVFFNTVKEQITLQEFAQQLTLGLIVEPGRRFRRYTERHLNNRE